MTDKLKELHFHCKCGARFEALPGRIEEVPDREWQPYSYFAPCPSCEAEAPQAAWELNLAKGWASATGPRTAEGKAASAKNLDGHPNQEEAKRTRLNAMKHGLFAQTAMYFPARPGKYPHCETCEHLNKGCDEFPLAGHKNPPACLKRTEIMMRYQLAFESRDPSMLRDIYAGMQAAVWHITNEILLTIMQQGVLLKTPEWYYDKDGEFHVAQYVDEKGSMRIVYKEIRDHPLLKHLTEILAKNGMTLPDSGMTAKLQDEQETVKGFLAKDQRAVENESEFKERQTKALEKMSEMVQRSMDRKKRDPVLLDHANLEREQNALTDDGDGH